MLVKCTRGDTTLQEAQNRLQNITNSYRQTSGIFRSADNLPAQSQTPLGIWMFDKIRGLCHLGTVRIHTENLLCVSLLGHSSKL